MVVFRCLDCDHWYADSIDRWFSYACKSRRRWRTIGKGLVVVSNASLAVRWVWQIRWRRLLSWPWEHHYRVISSERAVRWARTLFSFRYLCIKGRCRTRQIRRQFDWQCQRFECGERLLGYWLAVGDLCLVSLFQTNALRSGERLVIVQCDVILFVRWRGRASSSHSTVEMFRRRRTRRSAEISSDLQFSLSSSLDCLFSFEWVGKLLSYSSVKRWCLSVECACVCFLSFFLYRYFFSHEIIRHTRTEQWHGKSISED